MKKRRFAGFIKSLDVLHREPFSSEDKSKETTFGFKFLQELFNGPFRTKDRLIFDAVGASL